MKKTRVIRKGLRALLAASSVSACLLLAACSKKGDPASGAKGTPGRPPVPVLTAVAVARDVPMEVRAVGNAQSLATVAVRSRITGQILQVHFKEGDDVKEGQLLFTIDPRASDAALLQAQANSKRDEALLESARLEFDREQKLTESGIVSRDDFDKAQAAFQSLQATVLADRAAISNAALNVEYTRIRSPLTGRTGDILVKAGNIVKSEDDNLVTIKQVHPIGVAFAVPEQELPAIRANRSRETLPVTVTLPGSTNIVASGELSFIDNAVDPTTGTILLKAIFPNEDNTLWPGQFVQARLVVNTLKNATVVPSQAVQSSQSGEFVFVVGPEQTVEKRSVKLGITRDGIAVIEHGVAPGETVVIDGQMRLVPKARVVVQRPEDTGSDQQTNKGRAKQG